MFVLQRDSPQVLEEAGLDGRGRICKHKLSNLTGGLHSLSVSHRISAGTQIGRGLIGASSSP